MDMAQSSVLLVRAHGRLCAFSLSDVWETMRPLPIRPSPRAPSFVLGLARLRGSPTPVIDLSQLLGDDEAFGGSRFVTLGNAADPVALAVESVVGIHELPARALEGLPSVLSYLPEQGDELDAGHDSLRRVLDAARVVPESFWHGLEVAPRPAPEAQAPHHELC
jgi:purine-binding chemotaxis protein CheW